MKIIGITGGIASGKSTVTKMFAELGARTLSADDDARAVLQIGSPTLLQVREAFPEAFNADGTLVRSRLGARIFVDANARSSLEAITHPEIVARMRAAIKAARKSDEEGLLIYETPLLYEVGLASLFDAVIVVVTSPAEQTERLQNRERAAGRSPLTAADIADRLAAQLSSDEKARRADYVIHNEGALTDTQRQARRIFHELHGGIAA